MHARCRQTDVRTNIMAITLCVILFADRQTNSATHECVYITSALVEVTAPRECKSLPKMMTI